MQEFYRIYLCSLLAGARVFAEIITLSHDRDITCIITGQSTDSAVYLSPPVHSEFKKPSITLDNWTMDDWTNSTSDDLNEIAVIDKRWEDFELLDEETGLAFKKISWSFSIWNSGFVAFRVMDRDNCHDMLLNFTDSVKTNTHRWSHYTFVKNNTDLHVFSGSKEIASYQLNFVPFWVYFHKITPDPIFWKLHNFSFRVAQDVTQTERSSIDLTLNENLCLSMYVSVDEGCFLDITLETEKENVSKPVIGFNKNGNFNKWQKVEIRATAPGHGKLTFFRGRQQQDEVSGYWAIDDIHFCNKDLEVYHAQLKEELSNNYICQVLNDGDKMLNTEPNIISCKEPGYLGRHCNVTCEVVLGETFPYCEKHKICQSDSTCFCSSGYHGSDCEQTCIPGTWGLYCQNKCLDECEKCHPSTGKCLDENVNVKVNILESTSNAKLSSSSPQSEQISTEKQNWPTETKQETTPKLETFTEKDLPSNVSFVSNEVYIYLPQEPRTVTYDLKYLCVSEWCKNKVIETDVFTILENVNYTNPIKRTFKQLLPFTQYEPIINVLGQNVNRKYDKIQTDKRISLDVHNLSVYCSNRTSLWIRFQVPEIPKVEMQYKIWYQPRDMKTSRPEKVNVSKCEIWENFMCGRIDNLHGNTYYSTIIGKSDGNSWLFSTSQEGFTDQEKSQAPENLAILKSTDHKAELTWDHPSLTNGPIQEFIVEVLLSNGTVNNYTVNVEKPQKNYIFEISIDYYLNYSFSVHGRNKFQGAKSTLSAYFIPNPYSHNLVMEICYSSCQLLIPKPEPSKNYTDCNILVTPDEGASEDTLKIFKRLKANPSLNQENFILIALNDYNENYFQVFEEPHKVASFLNSTQYVMNLIVSEDNYNYTEYRINMSQEETKVNYATSTVAAAVLIIILMLLLVFLRLRYLKGINFLPRTSHHKNGTKRNLKYPIDQKEQEKLNPNKSLQENFTRIETRHLENYLKNALLTGKDLIYQFRSLPASTHPVVHAFQNKNKNKNRDQQYLPYDHSRVILKKMDGMGTDDYINASYINGLTCPKVYIATQGPKFSTIRDFWRMVWQEKIQTIVMATNFMENKQRKCAEYFPQGIHQKFDCGQMTIKVVNEEAYEHYDHRILDVYYKKSARRIHHYQLKWNPDDLTPLSADRVVPLVKTIGIIRERSTTPIVVHCSSGSNRTGTLILCDLALEMAGSENCVDFYALIKDMRNQRPHMICSEKQYILAHLVILECLMEPNDVLRDKLQDNVNLKILKSQLTYLEKLCHHDEIVKSWTPPRNSLFEGSVPRCLVDGYARHRKYVVTQLPVGNSLFDFWNLVIRDKIRIVVFLDASICQVWPFLNQTPRIAFRVEELHSVSTDYCKSTKLLLLTTQTATKQILHEQTVFFLQLDAHSRKIDLKETDNFLNILEDIHKNCDPTTPTLVACNDGMTKSGLLVSLSYIIEKYQRELDIDICNGIRTVRRSGTKFVRTCEQMSFVYKAVSEHIKKFDPYTSVL